MHIPSIMSARFELSPLLHHAIRAHTGEAHPSDQTSFFYWYELHAKAFSNAISGQIRQMAVGHFYTILFCFPIKEGGLSARRLA
jgi:hypothetical protein